MTQNVHTRPRLPPEVRDKLNILERVAHALTGDDPTLEGPRTNGGPFRWAASVLDCCGVAAWHVSLLGILVTVVAAVVLPSWPLTAGVLILLGVLFDCIDGVLARLNLRPAPLGLRGDVVDTACDLSRVLLIVGGLVAAGYMPSVTRTWLLGTLLVANALVNAAKNRSALGRALSLFNQTFVVCGAMALLVIGRQSPLTIWVPSVVDAANAVLLVLILQSLWVWRKDTRDR